MEVKVFEIGETEEMSVFLSAGHNHQVYSHDTHVLITREKPFDLKTYLLERLENYQGTLLQEKHKLECLLGYSHLPPEKIQNSKEAIEGAITITQANIDTTQKWLSEI